MNLDEAYEVVMPFGKHKGETLKDIFRDDESYGKWLLDLDDTRGDLADALEAIRDAQAEA